MSNIEIEKIGTGAIPREWDKRNIIYSEMLAGAEALDWERGFDLSELIPLKVEHQGSSSSCVGQAWSKYAEVLEYMENKQFKDLSARFIYSRIYEPQGGAYIYKGAKVLNEIGVASENTVSSYENGNPPSEDFMRVLDNSEAVLNEAKIYRAKFHAYVDFNIDSFALAIKQQHGLVTGFRGSYEGVATPFIRPPLSNEQQWGHAVYCVGAKLIEGKKYIKFINSWGEKWGDKGMGYLGEDYFASGMLFNAITLVDLPDDWFKESFEFKRDLKYGQRHPDIVQLQKALKNEGLFPKDIPETGYYGEITRKAVLEFWKKYQIASWYEITFLQGRVVGPKTRAKLNELLNK